MPVVWGTTLVCLATWGGVAAERDDLRAQFETRFLRFCDLAAAELNKPITAFTSRTNANLATHHMPFFEDGHAVRALAAGYDLTGKRAYREACKRWSDQMSAKWTLHWGMWCRKSGSN